MESRAEELKRLIDAALRRCAETRDPRYLPPPHMVIELKRLTR